MRRSTPYIVSALLTVLGVGSALGVNAGVRAAVQLPAEVVLEPSGSDGRVPDAAVASGIPAEGADAPSEGPTPSADPASAADAGAPAKPERPRGRTLQQYRDAILARNIFDHTATPDSGAPSSDPAPTDLNLRLVATLVAEPSQYSSALIVENGKEGSATGYGIGDRIGDAEITAIEARRVSLLRGNGTTEYLLLEDKAAAPPAAPTEGKPAEENTEGGISQLGENRYAIDRSILDKHLTDLTALSTMARAVPHRGTDGEVDGYRLSGVRRNSTLYQLGIRNGDVVHNVNGSSLASMQDAMTAYQGLQSQSRFTFDITRRGQRQTMEYEVR